MSSSTARTPRPTALFCATLSVIRTSTCGRGWLVFKLPPAEVAVHPAGESESHELFLMCDDITQTVADLTARGVEFPDPPQEQGWGILTTIRLPGGGNLGLYQPHHQTAHDL